MFKQLFIFLFAITLTFSAVTSKVEAASAAEALKRIDAIIVEMQALRAEFVALTAVTSAAIPTPQVQGTVSGGILGSDLAFGSTNDDIKKIQKLLATDPSIYPYGVASGFFGPKTQEAIRMFQARFDLDTVGVVGPSTRALLEVFFAAYPSENYPADVLKKAAPQVAGASTTVTPATTATTPVHTTGILRSISVTEDDDEYIVRSYTTSGTRNRDLILYPDDADELVEMIAEKLGVSEAEVRRLVDEDDFDFDSQKKSRGADEGDAEDALKDADDAIDKARDEIREADDDGDDVDDADELYDEARDAYKDAREALKEEDYDEAVELAQEAEELAKDAIDEIGGSSSNNNSDDIDVIEVDVREGESRVTVEYDNGDDEKFTVEDEDKDDVIEEIADELDIEIDEVEDLVEFDYGDIQRISSSLNGSTILVRVYFESGVDAKFTFDEDEDEDDIVKKIAKELELDKDDVERELDLDF